MRALIEMAIRAQEDADAIPVLGDMLIEAGMVDRVKPFVMMLLIGVPIDNALPMHIQLKGAAARETYRAKLAASRKDCLLFWDRYSNANSPTWARAVLATLLFKDWLKATNPTRGRLLSPGAHVDYTAWLPTRSPWAVVRAPFNRQNALDLAERRALQRLG